MSGRCRRLACPYTVASPPTYHAMPPKRSTSQRKALHSKVGKKDLDQIQKERRDVREVSRRKGTFPAADTHYCQALSAWHPLTHPVIAQALPVKAPGVLSPAPVVSLDNPVDRPAIRGKNGPTWTRVSQSLILPSSLTITRHRRP